MTTPQNVYVHYPPKAPSNGLAIAGMVLGIVALVAALIPFVGWFMAFVPALLAIIFGHIGHATANRNGVGKGAAIAAWATGYAALVLPPLGLLFIGTIASISQ